jgi:hypothetical protein
VPQGPNGADELIKIAVIVTDGAFNQHRDQPLAPRLSKQRRQGIRLFTAFSPRTQPPR